PCLGSPSPVEAGFWSALRTPGSLSASVGQRAHARHPSGAPPILRRCLLGWHHPDVQLVELFLIDRAWGVQHQVLHALRLRERDDIANVVRTGQQHDDAVDSGCDAPMRGHAVLESLEQETEPLANRFVVEAEQLEDATLQVGLVDAEAAAR